MSKFLTLAFFVLVSLYAHASEDLKPILALKPGQKLDSKLSQNQTTKTYSYSIEKENDLIRSVVIDFKSPVPFSKYVSGKSEGFCLVQVPKGDVKRNRYFFFNKETDTRYELNPEKKLIGILIQSMPGAREHKPCTLDTFDVKGDK